MLFSKKGMGLTDLVPVAIVFIVAAVAIGFGAKILADLSASQAAGTVSKAVIDNGTESLNQLGKYLPTLALVAVAAIVVGLVITAFAFRGR